MAEIRGSRAWFSFDLSELYWLLDQIPAKDGFRDEVKEAIKKLEDDDQ